jgi:hypothetical protein
MVDEFTGILRVIVPPSTAEGVQIVIYSLSETKKLEDEILEAAVKEYPVIGKAAVFHHLLPGSYRLPNRETVVMEAGKQKDVNLSTN